MEHASEAPRAEAPRAPEPMLAELVGEYGAQVATTQELAPSNRFACLIERHQRLLTAALCARQWFENDPAKALDEIEHHARAVVAVTA